MVVLLQGVLRAGAWLRFSDGGLSRVRRLAVVEGGSEVATLPRLRGDVVVSLNERDVLFLSSHNNG